MTEELFNSIPLENKVVSRDHYIDVPRNLWNDLILNMQIKIDDTTGKEVGRGFIISIKDDLITFANMLRYLSKKSKAYKVYTINFNQIGKLWKYIDRLSLVEITRLQGMIKLNHKRITVLEDLLLHQNKKIHALAKLLKSTIEKINTSTDLYK